MNDDRNAASGSCARMDSIIARNFSPLPHRFMARSSDGIGVLEGEVEVGDDGGELEHGRDQRVAHLARVEVEEPDPLETVGPEMVEPAEQRRERAGLAGVAAVPREVLRDEHDLGDAAVDEGRGPRPRSTPACVTAACPGTTGWRRTRTRGRSLRRSSRRPRAPTGRRGAARADRARRWACAGAGPTTPTGPASLRPRTRRPRRPRAAPPRARRRQRSARQPVTTSFAPGFRAAESARMVSTDSWRAASMNAHVFTTTTSASSGPRAGVRPSANRDATTLSESTAFFGQPRVSMWKRWILGSLIPPQDTCGASPVSFLPSPERQSLRRPSGLGGAHPRPGAPTSPSRGDGCVRRRAPPARWRAPRALRAPHGGDGGRHR